MAFRTTAVVFKSKTFSTVTAAKPKPELLAQLPERVAYYVQRCADICQPSAIEVCDGSEAELSRLTSLMESEGTLKRLRSPKLDNCWLALTDPADVARVESRTVISTTSMRETVAPVKQGMQPVLGQWRSPDSMETELNLRFPGCMRGRTMYVTPFSMGPIGSPLSKLGIELTDSPYVVASMRVMTRMGAAALEASINQDFVGCLHSLGRPLPHTPAVRGWPCNPDQTLIAHLPEQNEICSFGSGYGGNSLLGKKCVSLRLGSILARREGWLAEHMLILGVTPPNGRKRYIAAAFPSACGKTNLAMLRPSLPGYKVETVGDDIAWMRFAPDGTLRAINPEAGFFGVAPGTSSKTNPIAMSTIQRNTIFTNVAETSEGGVYWEGLEKEVPADLAITDWHGKPWTRNSKTPAAHPNSRFCAPATNCPILDPQWENSEGVPIDAILFGGRRPEGFPLVFEPFDWDHGVLCGASMRSEATAAAEHKGKELLPDPFAMRPFFGYNFGDYLQHWLDLPKLHPRARLPKVFCVNWFRKDPSTGQFLWPGFGENSRVIDWVLRRLDDPACQLGESGALADYSPIGYLPKREGFNLDGMSERVDWAELFKVPREFWQKEAIAVEKFLDEQVGDDTPEKIKHQLKLLKERVSKWDR